MDDNFDAFTQGIALGGLRTKNEIRILLCYILKNIGAPVSKSGLDEILQSSELVNFFESNSALASLSEAGLVREEARSDDKYYSLTDEGVTVADGLDTEIPISVREKAVKTACTIISRDRARRNTKVDIVKLARGYNVVMTVSDNDTVMMQTVLYAADSMQAAALEESFLRNPEKLYSNIVDTLTLN